MDDEQKTDLRFCISAAQLLHDWKSVYQRTHSYLAALGVEEPRRRDAVLRALKVTVDQLPASNGESVLGSALEGARRVLRGQDTTEIASSDGDSKNDFLTWRLKKLTENGAACKPLQWGQAAMRSMPALARGSMRPNRLVRRWLRRNVITKSSKEVRISKRSRPQWVGPAVRRRILLSILVLIPSGIASSFMLGVLPHKGESWLELAIAFFFGALFGWISIGFWTALLGFFVLIRGRERFAITKGMETDKQPLDPGARTAILMPICEEPVDRVFAGLKAMYRSLERTGELEHFDFFILSDTGEPSRWVDEEMAWFEWCRSVGGFGRIFYRHRRARIERKSGNIADFCARWGQLYRYGIMLDADSVMTGDALVKLVRLMERHPEAGMIQTAPVAVNRRSLFARMQQFAARIYGPMFAAGLHYWQLGEGQYWGHNAIIRLAPFMEHCALPRLPGKPPLGGEILSHDFVEAALMGRAGWELWLAYDIEGSYEEMPSSLLEEMTRDRRWCQGNLQHLRLVFTRGLHSAHRALFLNGVLSYVSALLWFAFLTLSTAEVIWEALREPDYFPAGRSLFPEWPIWRPYWAFSLLAITAAILFLPKILSIFLILFRHRGATRFGGIVRLSLSMLLEITLSALLAPIRMVFHARFVATNLMGRTVSWRSQTREDSETSWRDAIRQHGFDTIWASAWGAGVYALNPDYFWWLTPIIVALMLSVPLSAITSSIGLGERVRRLGLFLIPEETTPPEELRDLAAECDANRRRKADAPMWQVDGFVRAVVDPAANAVHCALLGRPRSSRASIKEQRRTIAERALSNGPQTLDARHRRTLLLDPEQLDAMHHSVWRLESAAAERWGIA